MSKKFAVTALVMVVLAVAGPVMAADAGATDEGSKD